MSQITQLYVFPGSFSLHQQIEAVQKKVTSELSAAFHTADFLVVNGNVETNETSALQIEQVRDLQLEVLRAPLQHSQRVLLIANIQDASTPALNALLKLLEEPPAHIQFLLTTPQLETVLETIQSRCQIITIEGNSTQPQAQLPDEITAVLTHQPPRPLSLQQVFALSETYKERPQAVEFIQQLITTLHSSNAQTPTTLTTSVLQKALESLSLLEGNVNTRLVVEELLFSFVQTGQSR